MFDSLSLIIQAGGRSSRMGEDKGLKCFLGKPLVQRVVERVGHLAAEILVTTNHPEAYTFLNIPTISDIYPVRGTLGGLYTALNSASLPLVAIVACDLPFASAAIIERMVALLEEEQMDIVVPHSGGGLEPLHAVYRRKPCLQIVHEVLNAGEQKVISWFPRVRVREFSMDEAASCDPSGLAFWNVNTPGEFLEAERIAQEMEGTWQQG